jgi:toxin ParE1/3/4
VIGNYVMYYLPDLEQHIIYILRLIYGRRSVEEILRQLEI